MKARRSTILPHHLFLSANIVLLVVSKNINVYAYFADNTSASIVTNISQHGI